MLGKIKKIFWLFAFLLFSGAVVFLEQPAIPQNTVKLIGRSDFIHGLARREVKSVNPVANYDFNIIFNDTQKTLKVKEKIVWKNLTSFSTKEIYFHLYANAYKSNNTLFASEYHLTKEAQTHLEISSFKINGVDSELKFITPDVPNPHDSTVAKVDLPFEIKPGDSVEIKFDYSLKIPKSVKRFGYAPGTDFALISQWYPKPGVFENGVWNCHQYFAHLNFFSDFANFSTKVIVPRKYKVVSTGVLESTEKKGEKTIWLFKQNGVHDFAWAIGSESKDTVRVYVLPSGEKVKTELFVYPTDAKYTERIFETVFNALDYFGKNILEYPYEKITVVDVPPTSRSGGMEYPTLITVSAPLFSPVDTHSPEKLVAHEFIHQYFYGILANNETEEAWLDEGFTSYFASKVMEKYYPPANLNFRFLGYIPVYGINYLSFSDIPVIYTLGYNDYPEYAKALKQYYSNLTIGAIKDVSYKLPTRLSYVVNSYSKPEIMFYTLERILGEKDFLSFVRTFAERFKFKHPAGKDFWNLLLELHPDLEWFKQEVFNSSVVFDDRIRYLKKTGENEYELFAERLGDGYFPHKIAVYTKADTIHLDWSEKGRYKVFRFKSKSEVTGADIDPNRINLFDLNFANNSFTIDSKNAAKYSLVTRWFFWLQNALMILGSAG